MVERSLSMREVPGSIPGTSISFSVLYRNRHRHYISQTLYFTGTILCMYFAASKFQTKISKLNCYKNQLHHLEQTITANYLQLKV